MCGLKSSLLEGHQDKDKDKDDPISSTLSKDDSIAVVLYVDFCGGDFKIGNFLWSKQLLIINKKNPWSINF